MISNILGRKDFYEGKYSYSDVESIGRYEPLLKDGIWNPRTETGSAAYRNSEPWEAEEPTNGQPG